MRFDPHPVAAARRIVSSPFSSTLFHAVAPRTQVVTVGIAVKKIMGTLNTFYEFRRLSESGLVSSQLLKEVDRVSAN